MKHVKTVGLTSCTVSSCGHLVSVNQKRRQGSENLVSNAETNSCGSAYHTNQWEQCISCQSSFARFKPLDTFACCQILYTFLILISKFCTSLIYTLRPEPLVLMVIQFPQVLHGKPLLQLVSCLLLSALFRHLTNLLSLHRAEYCHCLIQTLAITAVVQILKRYNNRTSVDADCWLILWIVVVPCFGKKVRSSKNSIPLMTEANATRSPSHALANRSVELLTQPCVAVFADALAQHRLDLKSLPEGICQGIEQTLFPYSRFVNPDNIEYILTWDGWTEIVEVSEATDLSTDACFEKTVSICKRLCSIILSNGDMNFISDSECITLLKSQGLHLFDSRAFESNACLIDSLHVSLLCACQCTDVFYYTLENRRQVADLCRSYLNSHVDLSLRPYVRDEQGRIHASTGANHNQAFLQHDIHAQAIIIFLLKHYDGVIIPEFQVIGLTVHTRFDISLPVDFSDLIVAPCSDEKQELVSNSLHLYNHTNNCVTGIHYDALMSCDQLSLFKELNSVPSSMSNSATSHSAKELNNKLSTPLCCDNSTADASTDSPNAANAVKKRKITSQLRRTYVNSALLSADQDVSFDDAGANRLFDDRMKCISAESMKSVQDHRLNIEAAMHKLASSITEYPTLPSVVIDKSQDVELQSFAGRLPCVHCAFVECEWSSEDFNALTNHLMHDHIDLFTDILNLISNSESKYNNVMSIYEEAIAIKCRMSAPIASYAIDRRCLNQFAKSMNDEQELKCLICFFCARKYVHHLSDDSAEIKYYKGLAQCPTNKEKLTFLDADIDSFVHTFGLKAYIEKYALRNENNEISQEFLSDLQDWTVVLDHNKWEASSVICCPEDIKCSALIRHSPSHVCEACAIPVCSECNLHCRRNKGKSLMDSALANDLLIFYAPKEIYEDRVTTMELICSSACITSLICFSLEKKYRGDRPVETNAFFHRHKLGARGNATTFLLPWESLVSQLSNLEADDQNQIDLPRTGKQAAEVVSILLKTSNASDDVEALAGFIHEARVRRRVVINLILNAKKRGHRAYKNVNTQEVVRKAELMLPEDGVIPEVLHLLPPDGNLDNIQCQKAATPHDVPSTLEEAAAAISRSRPNCVVLERNQTSAADHNAQKVAAIHNLTPVTEKKSSPDSGKNKDVFHQVVLQASNRMLNQFEPWYFGVAFSFLFKYCLGMPDYHEKSISKQYRRIGDSPLVHPERWITIMSRRVEAQLGRDWQFGFVCWNVYFRMAINLSRSIYFKKYTQESDQGSKDETTHLEAAAIEICKNLRGTYLDESGRKRNVNGDLSKLKRVPNISAKALLLLRNIERMSVSIAGTQETRRLMRFQLQGYRIQYGLPIFVTFSPDDSHSLLAVRLSRTRASDPITQSQFSTHSLKCNAADFPSLQLDLETIHAFLGTDSVWNCVPDWCTRKEIIARDPFASATAFRFLVLLTLKHLFGVKFCPHCPDCAWRSDLKPCQNIFGSSATVVGGIFGRVDAVFGSIEAQKSQGCLHAHCQLFIQCMHQHMSLKDILKEMEFRAVSLVKQYKNYKKHVSRQVYTTTGEKLQAQIEHGEQNWPEYKDNWELITRPSYQCDGSIKKKQLSSAEWLSEYLEKDVECLQIMKQHHVHVLNPKTNKKEPLPSCRNKDRPLECKSGFPKDKALCEETVVLCPKLLRDFALPHSGKKNMIGSLHGPCNHPYLNGTHPALLAALRCNSDVQIPYRLPLVPESHSCCDNKCLDFESIDAMIQATQTAQDAQCGYITDYCCKRSPLAVSEVKECMKGHVTLARELVSEVETVRARRHTLRLMSDFYSKGLVRGAVECANLRMFNNKYFVTHAESIQTCQTHVLPGNALIRLVERLNDGILFDFDVYSSARQRLANGRSNFFDRRPAVLYGCRPNNKEFINLSPYEFFTHFEFVLAQHEFSAKVDTSKIYHSDLTQSGKSKMHIYKHLPDTVNWKPGVDYHIRSPVNEGWFAFPDLPATQGFRHNWIISARRRPVVLSFLNCPLPSKQLDNVERNSMIILTYFSAWSLIPDYVSEQVSLAGEMKKHRSWTKTFEHWLHHHSLGVAATRHINNFMSMFKARTVDDDNASDVDSESTVNSLQLSLNDLDDILLTRSSNAPVNLEDELPLDADKANLDIDPIRLVQHIWSCELESTQSETDQAISFTHDSFDVEAMNQAARVSRSKTTNGNASHTPTIQLPSEGVSYVSHSWTADSVDSWIQDLKQRKRPDGRRYVNDGQFSFINRIANRIKQEIVEGSTDCHESSDPLRWLLHGGPGTGKSHVLKILRTELFENIMGWIHGVHFQLVALQAVTAQQLQGDTLHHACNLPIFHNMAQSSEDSKSFLQLQKQAARWRWFIIDEISMISARLLAETESKLRDITKDTSIYKYNQQGEKRPFGGLNVIFSGDFYQLPPPEGGFLASVPDGNVLSLPSSSGPSSIAYGLSLMWGSSSQGIQGVSELTESERCTDSWLFHVQNEIRTGKLSYENYCLLHGYPTHTPGSSLGNTATCQNKICQELLNKFIDGHPVSCTDVLKLECSECKNERNSKALVAHTSDDVRFTQVPFVDSLAIFANNDIKYETNKLRAYRYASALKKHMLYIYARDTPKCETIAERLDLHELKKQWLQRHDRESGDLYGVLPLAIGMPVALTDHIDRSSKQLLRGRIGTVVSIHYSGDNMIQSRGYQCIASQMPTAVIVQFYEPDMQTCNWTLTSHCKPGCYPIVPIKKTWYLDKGRPNPVLKISRQQLPLAPAFAITAYAAQGQTLNAAIVDMRVPPRMSVMNCYVALSRVRHRSRLLIFTPFDYKAYENCSVQGPDLLLKKLRGEHIDLVALSGGSEETQMCHGCSQLRFRKEYAKLQWLRVNKKPYCTDCIRSKRQQGTPLECIVCGRWQPLEAFDPSQHHHMYINIRTCISCTAHKFCTECKMLKKQCDFSSQQWSAKPCLDASRKCIECSPQTTDAKTCSKCQIAKQCDGYTALMWTLVASDERERLCRSCLHAQLHHLKCCRCKLDLDRSEFSIDKSKKKRNFRLQHAVCNACVVAEENAISKIRKINIQHVSKQ